MLMFVMHGYTLGQFRHTQGTSRNVYTPRRETRTNTRQRTTSLNPYALQYLKQMLTRGGRFGEQAFKRRPTLNLQQQQRPTVANPRMNLQKPHHRTAQINPQLVNALYGSTFISPTRNDAGKYSYAQIQPQQRKPQQQMHRAPFRPQTNVHPVKAPQPSLNLGGMLYKHAMENQIAKKQSPPTFNNFNQNFYRMFAPTAYGPMPRPSPSLMTSYPRAPFQTSAFAQPIRKQISRNPYQIQVHGHGVNSANLGYTDIGKSQNSFDLKGKKTKYTI